VNGNVRTDQEIVQEALAKYAQTSGAPSRGDALAALGRLVADRDTAQEKVEAFWEALDECHAERVDDAREYGLLREKRDVAIQERDEAKGLLREYVDELVTKSARLERVEAAAREAHHIAMTRRVGGPRMDGSEEFASPAFKQIRDVLAAALSDVTPEVEK
jgi:hypothetical protein